MANKVRGKALKQQKKDPFDESNVKRISNSYLESFKVNTLIKVNVKLKSVR